MKIEFAKLSGSGNDFVCIDNRDGRYDAPLSDAETAASFARELCSRSKGIGADGLIVALEPDIPGVADIAARFLESDGTECKLCGNGTACFAYWVEHSGWAPPGELKILTPAGVVLAEDGRDGYVRVCIPLPENTQTDLTLEALGEKLTCDYVVTGVPHAITYVEDVDSADICRLGPALRSHEKFQPRGANANFVEILDEGEIALRTWEFGVEGETLACGTGSAAAAILAAVRHEWPDDYMTGRKPVLVHSRGGDILRVYFTRQEDGGISDVCLETVVRFLFTGTVHADLAARAFPDGSPQGTPARAPEAAG